MPSKDQKQVANGNKNNQNGDSDISSEEDYEMAVPPDGGWGWAVVLSSFFIHVIADGICYSFGILFVELIDFFKTGRGETSWIGSLVIGMTLSTGPIASALTNKYGCRVVTIAGAIITFCGFVISVFTPNIYFMFFSFGILSGFGFGLIYLPAIVSVGYYFEKRRAFATGLAVCGSGIGTFVFAPLTQFLLNQYGWQGTVLILGGFVANCIICGTVFRPLLPVKKNKSYKDTADNPEEKQALTQDIKDETISPKRQKSEEIPSPSHLMPEAPKMVRSVGNIHSTVTKRQAKQSGGSLQHLHVTESHGSPTRGPLYRKDIFYSGSIVHIPAYKSNPTLYSTSVVSIPNRLEADGSPKKKPKACACCSNEMLDTFREMLDFSLLKDPIFFMFAFSNLLTSIGFYVPFIYLPDYAQERGIDPQTASFLLSVIGIANTIGRVLFGFISDLPFVSRYRLHVYNTSLLVCGISTALAPFADTYVLMVVYGTVFGVTVGSYVSLTSVILVDLLGLEKLTSSFGITLMFQGIATFIGPPIAGWIYDGTGSYDISFIVCGVTLGFSGFMLYFIPLVQKATGRLPPPKADVEQNGTPMIEISNFDGKPIIGDDGSSGQPSSSRVNDAAKI